MARPPTAAINTAKNAMTHSSIVPTRASRNRSLRFTLGARAAFFHIDARFAQELAANLPKPLEIVR